MCVIIDSKIRFGVDRECFILGIVTMETERRSADIIFKEFQLLPC